MIKIDTFKRIVIIPRGTTIYELSSFVEEKMNKIESDIFSFKIVAEIPKLSHQEITNILLK